MIQVGDAVVVMSAPGVFTVVKVDGVVVTIENAAGVRKTVLDISVRRLPRKLAP